MRKVKRFAALLLCGALTLTALAGCGGNDSGTKESSSTPAESKSEESKADDAGDAEDAGDAGSEASGDRVHFSLTGYNTIAGTDYHDPIVRYIEERFGVDMEFMANEPSGAAEKIRIGITGGTLPDAANWEDFSIPEYYSYIEQDLLKPMPDGWEEKYPNIAKAVQVSGIGEALKVDGKTYGVPHVVYDNFVEMDPAMSHATLFFRKDWAEEVGMPDLGKDYKMTLSELKEYLEKVKAAGLTNDGAYISANISNTLQMFGYATGTPNGRTYIKTDSGYKYTFDADKDKWIHLIEVMREWYKAGLIYPDYATVNDIFDNRAALMAGTLAAMYDSGDCVNTNTYMTGYVDNFPDQDAYDYIGGAHILTDDGDSYILETGNYWTVQIFAPETDDATLDKILEIMDWGFSPEGEITVWCGVPEVDWKYADDGSVEVINVVDEKTYPSTKWTLGTAISTCNDEIGYSGANAAIDPRAIDQSMAIFKVKEAGTVIPLELDYSNYSSPTKDVYSVNYQSKINELVADDEDIASAWDAFLEENRGMWEPLLNELNEYYGF